MFCSSFIFVRKRIQERKNNLRVLTKFRGNITIKMPCHSERSEHRMGIAMTNINTQCQYDLRARRMSRCIGLKKKQNRDKIRYHPRQSMPNANSIFMPIQFQNAGTQLTTIKIINPSKPSNANIVLYRNVRDIIF